MTKAKSNAMSDFVLPIAVLVIICAVMSGLLALTNSATAPIIAEAERKANEEARLEVLPQADSFLQVEQAGLPEAVRRDMWDNNAFWQRYEGRVSEAATRVNDTYLKVNSQAEGVKSYGRVVDLMLAYHRQEPEA